MDILGKLEESSLEFIDLNKDNLETKKYFSSMIRRCEEIEKKLINLENFAEKFEEKFWSYKTYKQFLDDLDNDLQLNRNLNGTYFDHVENEIAEKEKEIIELIDSYTKIKENLEAVIEKKLVYEKSLQLITTDLLQQYRTLDAIADKNNLSFTDEEGIQTGLNFVSGVANIDDELRMKRMIFRASKGRALVTFLDLPNVTLCENVILLDDDRKQNINKRIYTIFFHGESESYLMEKLIKICDMFNCSRYKIPKSMEIQKIIEACDKEIQEQQNFLREADGSIRNNLREKLGSEDQPGKLQLYKFFFRKEKIIYVNLSKCTCSTNFIEGEVWILKREFETIKDILKNSENEKTAPTVFMDIEYDKKVKPTHFKITEFFWAFQEIVNTYGIPKYKEINPTYFNIVTFPFLFGVMFGDIGHGLILFLFGIYLCLFSDSIKENKKSPLFSFIQARYLILFMGFFAFYCGWIYNDFLSLPLPIFNSCYEENYEKDVPIGVREDTKCVYPFGVDPIWRNSKNELAFYNSFKMKMSVIIGVIHMLFGLILKGLNEIHFKNTIGFFFEFVPQLCFFGLLFGYMITMIFIKWSIDWTDNTENAPSLITQMLDIFLSFGKVQDKPLWGGVKGESGKYVQETFHQIILIICLILIPLMFIPKPILLYLKIRKQDKTPAEYDKLSDEIDLVDKNETKIESKIQKEGETETEHEEELSEIFVHSAIDSIEFILGTISNTASYLRLWALSLAHGELAKVFYHKTLADPISEGDYVIGFFKIFFGFFIFANTTFFVLMCMDSLECFLHTLRLHWVEFQSKFYKGTGYKFTPYTFKTLFEFDE